MGTGLSRVGRWSLAALALAWTACHEPEQVRQVDATAVLDTTALDFGDVPVGEWREYDVKVQNAGYVPFTATEALRLHNDPSFQAELIGGGKVMSGEQRTIHIRFHPLHEGELSDAVQVVTDAEHKPPGPLALRGRGIPTAIKVQPDALDYQTLELDSDRDLTVTVENPVDLPLTLSLNGDGADQFSSDTLTLPPYARQQVNARYLPHRLGHGAAQLQIRSCGDCTPTVVGLAGRAVASALSFDPEPVPFENVPVHEKTVSKTKATNIIWRPVTLSNLSTSDLSFAALTDLRNQTLQPGETVEVQMEFAARYTGPALGVLQVDYHSDKPRSTRVTLDARGGRPQLALDPVAIDFGDLPVGGKVERTVRLSNAGSNGNLHFQGVKGGGDAATQFSVSAPLRGGQSYAWNAGATWPDLTAPNLEIAPGADHLDVKVYFEPLAPGAFQGTITFRSDDLFNPERTIVVSGRAHASGPCSFRLLPEDQLDFGNVPPGRGAVLGFRFENAGQAECAVKDIHLSDDARGAFFMPGGPLTGGVVIANDAFSAQIAFLPPAGGTYHGELELTVNDPAQPVVRLPLIGASQPTCLTAAPGFVDFGAIRYDCATTPRHTYVSNQCDFPITVTEIQIGPGTGNEFNLLDAPLLPQTLLPGQGFEVQVGFARASLGQHYNPLFFTLSGQQEPLLVPLLGETNHEGVQLEQFVQGTDDQLDVLFVVSNTTTMEPYQDRLKAAIPGWLQRAKAAGVDLHVGVTSTGLVPRSPACGGGANGGEAGRLFPVDGSRPRIVAGGGPTAVPDLQADLGVGTCHNLVQGLEAMRQALTSPLIDHADDPRTPQPGDGNLGLLRAPARLAVVFLADEDDHSGFDPVSYSQLLHALKGPGAAQRTTAYAIVPTDPACQTAGPPGPRFAAVAQATGGQVLSVCSADYAPLLDPLAARAAGPQRDFHLDQQPVSDAEITVEVDGVAQGPDAWTFDAGTNSIVFQPGKVPAAGQAVRVRYRSICRATP